ncbi:MAG: CBS domain-containing protein [Bacteroidetes bacterium]|nr:CBS domain-containing protein [Bacteroidota bacterium]
MKTVEDILIRKSFQNNIIDADQKIIDALSALKAVNLSYMVVRDKGEIIGVFSERDYARKVVLEGRSSNESTIREVMSEDLPVVSPRDTIEHCMNLLANAGRRYILVKDNGNYRGVITIHDLLREILLNRESVFDDVVTGALIDINEHSSKVY